MIARRMMRKYHVRCRAGEKVEIVSKPYLSPSVLVECGKMLAKGTPKTKPKLNKNGDPIKNKKGETVTEIVRDKNGKIIYEPYRIKVLNTINFNKSMHYNPFVYLRSEKDILKLVTTIIANTKGEGEKSSEDFWVSATRSHTNTISQEQTLWA